MPPMRDYRSFFIGGTARSRQTDIALLLLRVFAGLALALGHGVGKVPPADGFVQMVGGMGFPAPLFWAWASGIAELVGGIAVAVGLFTRPAALLIVINHTVAAFIAHAGEAFAAREKALLFLGIAVLFLIVGSGRYTIDAILRKRGRRAPLRA